MQDAALGLRSKVLFPIKREDPKIRNQFKIDKISYDGQSVGKLVDKTSKIAGLLFNAEVLIKASEKNLARVLVYEALKTDSTHVLALEKAKNFLIEKYEIENIIKIQRQICKNDLSFQSKVGLANILYQAQQDEEALEEYFSALSLVVEERDELFDVYKNIGNIFTRANDFDAAEEYFNKAFTIYPNSDVLSVNLGTLLIQKNDFSAAAEKFRFAITVNPLNDKGWVGLALTHFQMSDFQLAMGNIEKAIDINVKNKTAIQLYANWCARTANYSAAITKIYDYMMATQDFDEEISLLLVHFLCKVNQLSSAELECEHILLWNPKNENIAKILAEIKYIRGK